jgi:acetyl esterase/lipase
MVRCGRRLGVGLGAILAAAVVHATPGAAQVAVDIAYGPSSSQRLDVFRRRLPGGEGRLRKTILFFHGGGWSRGTKDRLHFVGRTLAAAGYIVVSADYRLYPEVRFPTFVYDAARATAWVHANIRRWGGDRNRIYLMGHSAGAHIAMLVALDPRYLRAAGVPRSVIRGVIGSSGPYSFDPHRHWRNRKTFAAHPGINARPITYVAHHGPRLLLMQGGLDRRVLQSDAEAMAAAYRRAGGWVRLLIYPRWGHNGPLLALTPRRRESAPVLAEIAKFVGRP